MKHSVIFASNQRTQGGYINSDLMSEEIDTGHLIYPMILETTTLGHRMVFVGPCLLNTFCVFMCVHVCVHDPVCGYTCKCRERSMLEISLNYSLPQLLRQGLSLNL